VLLIRPAFEVYFAFAFGVASAKAFLTT